MNRTNVLTYLALYILILFVLPLFLRKASTTADYFLNSRRTPTWLLTCSNIATLIGAGAIITTASAAYTTGISYGLLMMVALSMAALAYIPISSRIRALDPGIMTPADLFGIRFGLRAKRTYSMLYLVLAVAWGALQFVAVTYLFQVFLEINYLHALLATGLVTILYTAVSGLRGDLYTDVFQLCLMLLLYALIGVGVWQDGSVPPIGALPARYFDPFAFGGAVVFVTGIFVAGLVLVPSAHYWLRINAAKNERAVRHSFLYSVPAMIFFPGGALLIGLCAVSVLPPGSSPDTVFYEMTRKFVPGSLSGLAVAGILSVMLSSIDSLILGGSAVLMSIWKHGETDINVTHARLSSAMLGGLMLGIAATAPQVVSLTLFCGYFALCFVPAVLLAIYWPRLTEQAAMWSIMGGTAVFVPCFYIAEKISFLPALIAASVIAVALSVRKAPDSVRISSKPG